MAYLYKRKGSPFWWLGYTAKNGATIQEPTPFTVGNALHRQKAEKLKAVKTLAEKSTRRVSAKERWEIWVSDFICIHYAQNPASRVRYLTAWRTLKIFLEENEVSCPRLLTREHCTAYMAWRPRSNLENAKFRAGHNTALLELKLLSLVMEEAIRRGYAETNPAHKLGIKRAPRKLFPEYSDEVLKLVLDAIPKEPEPRQTFLHNSFLIGRWHGVRLSETWLNPQTQVWQQSINGKMRWLILFHQKGGKQKPKLLHPELVPLMMKLREEGAVQTYERPKNPSREWFDFLWRCGAKTRLPNICFHSLRVTAATRMARAGIEERKAMEYLTHASTTVHAAYVRWQPQDMEECHNAL